MQGHPSARSRSCRVFFMSLFWRVCIFSFTLKQLVPPGAALSPAAAPAPAVCSALVCPPATEGAAHWWQTSGCRGSLWTLERARTYHASANRQKTQCATTTPKPRNPPNILAKATRHPHRKVRISSLLNRETSYFNLTFRHPGEGWQTYKRNLKICVCLIIDAN